MTNDFNPITSTKTKLVDVRSDGTRIYSHTKSGVAGNYIVTNETGTDWTACESLPSAIATIPGEPEGQRRT